MTTIEQRPPPLGLDVDHFRVRVVQDALAETTAAYWLSRAQALEDARPRPDDYAGASTTAQLAQADARCAQAAALCRHRATLSWPTATTEPDDTLEEVD